MGPKLFLVASAVLLSATTASFAQSLPNYGPNAPGLATATESEPFLDASVSVVGSSFNDHTVARGMRYHAGMTTSQTNPSKLLGPLSFLAFAGHIASDESTFVDFVAPVARISKLMKRTVGALRHEINGPR